MMTQTPSWCQDDYSINREKDEKSPFFYEIDYTEIEE